jgi:hypothetical protein
MPDTIPTNVTAERFDRYAARGLADEARDRRDDLRIGLVELVSALGHLKDAGDASGVHAYLGELAKLAYDGIASREGELLRDIDRAGQYAEPIDLTELDALT